MCKMLNQSHLNFVHLVPNVIKTKNEQDLKYRHARVKRCRQTVKAAVKPLCLLSESTATPGFPHLCGSEDRRTQTQHSSQSQASSPNH